MFFRKEFPAFRNAAERAIALNPNDSQARLWYANALGELGRFPEALDQMDKAQALDPSSFTTIYRTLLDRDVLTERLGEITQPTLIIHGSDDVAIPMWRAEELRDGIPGTRDLVVVEGAGHASNVSHPDPVNLAMAEFLRSV